MTFAVRFLVLLLRIVRLIRRVGVLLLRIARLMPRLSLLIGFRVLRLMSRFRFLPLLVRALFQFAR